MRSLFADLRYALRGFLRTPAFTFTAVATLAVGAGGMAVIFALLNALLLRPLPVDRPGDLVTLELRRTDGGGGFSFSYPQYQQLSAEPRGLSGLAALSLGQQAVVIGDGEPEQLLGFSVSGNYFEVLGLRPTLGRFLTARDEAEAESSPAVVISYDLWTRRFDADAGVIGSAMRINGHAFTIAGVAPAGYRGTIPAVGAQYWIPITAQALLQPGSMFRSPGMMHWLTLIGRLAPGTSREHAAALLSGRVVVLAADESLRFDRGGRDGRQPLTGMALSALRPLPPMAVHPVLGFFGVLLAAALLVLLIASVNIASMMLARASARTREMAVRRSLGASRAQLLRQLMTENLLLFVMGALAGLVLAAWVVAALPAILRNTPFPVDLQLAVDGRVVLFALATALLAGSLFGLAPALHGSGGSTAPALREGVTTPRATRLRSSFVVAQLALSMLLLLSAGLLGRALQRAVAIDPGFRTQNVAMLPDIDLSPFGYDGERGHAFFDAVRQRLEARPEIDAAGTAHAAPLVGTARRWFRPEGHETAPTEGVPYMGVDHGYMETLRVPLRAGRAFSAADRAGAPRVAMVNEEFARRYWPGENPVGKRLFDGPTGAEISLEVIGVTSTGRYASVGEDALPFVYVALAQHPSHVGAVFARSPLGTAAAVAAIRHEVRALEANIPVGTAAPVQQTLTMLLLPQRIASSALAAFGIIGLLLAVVGIYGLVAFTVAQRTREIGVRMAMGADRRHVVGLFLRHGAKLLLAGSSIGIVLAAVAGRLLTSLLYGTSPTDPVTFTLVPLVLAAAALFAAYLPARRASRLDPSVVLRSD